MEGFSYHSATIWMPKFYVLRNSNHQIKKNDVLPKYCGTKKKKLLDPLGHTLAFEQAPKIEMLCSLCFLSLGELKPILLAWGILGYYFLKLQIIGG